LRFISELVLADSSRFSVTSLAFFHPVSPSNTYVPNTAITSNNFSTIYYVYRGKRGEEVPENVTYARVDCSVKEIPCQLFYGCISLKEVNLPVGLEVIGESAFFDSTSLDAIYLPPTLKKILPGAFAENGVRSIELPDSLETIGEGAFYECYALQNFRIPPYTTKIVDGVFCACGCMLSISRSPKEFKRSIAMRSICVMD
jgi:hypothetical protein